MALKDGMTARRKDKCPCGSGKQYGKCCYQADRATAIKLTESEDLKLITVKVRSGLNWKIIDKTKPSGIPEVTSDPQKQIHEISMPTDMPDDVDLLYLHELAHADLAERIHCLFSSIPIAWADDVPESEWSSCVMAMRIATDWFADAHLSQWCPNALKSRVKQSYKEYMELHSSGLLSPDQDFYELGLMVAQAIYFGSPNTDLPSSVEPVVNKLLETDPLDPSLTALENLASNLLLLRHAVKLKCVSDGEDQGWDIAPVG